MKKWKFLTAVILCCGFGIGFGMIGCGEDDDEEVIIVIPDTYSGTYVYALEDPPGEYIARLTLTITSISGLCSDAFQDGQILRFGVQALSADQLVLVFLNAPSQAVTFERTAGAGVELSGAWTKASGKTFEFDADDPPVVPEQGVFLVILDPTCQPPDCAVLPVTNVKSKFSGMLLYLVPVAFIAGLRRKFWKNRITTD